MDESYSFPGSACDTGDCICGACEEGEDCSFHRTGKYAQQADWPPHLESEDD